MRVLSDVLSRLTIRLDEGRRAQVLELALQMYRLPLFGQFLKLHKCVTLVFRRLLSQAMDRPEVLNRMDQLLSLPVPGEVGFSFAEPSNWPGPLDYLAHWSPGGGLPDGFDRSSWNPHVERLIALVRGVSEEARSRAARRLHVLFAIGVLTDEEEAAFGAALWSRTDHSSGLPSQPYYPAFTLLSLPHPPDIDVGETVRMYLLARDFAPVVAGNGVMLRGGDQLARELRGGPAPLIAMTEEDRQAVMVDWTPKEAETILRKMSDLWDQEKGVLKAHLGSHLALPGHDLASRFMDWARLLAEVILPRIADTEDATKGLARDLVLEMDEAGACMSYATPALLYIDEDQLDRSSDRLWRGMQSADPGEVGEAIRGVVLWLMLRSRGGRIPSPPDRLLDELVNKAVVRRMPGLDWTLTHLANLLRLHPEQLEARHLAGLCVALRFLLEDTRLPVAKQPLSHSAPLSPIPVGDRPQYRSLSVALAARLAAR